MCVKLRSVSIRDILREQPLPLIDPRQSSLRKIEKTDAIRVHNVS